MSDFPTNAIIAEVDGGPFYRVRLEWVPRVGELIELFSYTEMQANNPSKMSYEVVQILHDVHEVAESVPLSLKGAHSVTVFVRTSNSAHFRTLEGQAMNPNPPPGQTPGDSRN
jgi:hypothetical protein